MGEIERGGEMEREIYSLSMSSLSHHCISIFSFSCHFLYLFAHFSLSIFSLFLYLLSFFAFSRHFRSLFAHFLSLHFLILSLSPPHFRILSPFSLYLYISSFALHFLILSPFSLSLSPFPIFFSFFKLTFQTYVALLMPNCLNKDSF